MGYLFGEARVRYIAERYLMDHHARDVSNRDTFLMRAKGSGLVRRGEEVDAMFAL